MASTQPRREIPFDRLETIFLDVGNTLVSMDYGWIAEELAARGTAVELEHLIREEARARPLVSRSLRERASASTETRGTFEIYLGAILDNLKVEAERAAELVEDLVPVFKGPERERLWSRVIPGVPEALEQMTRMGLTLAVVSNSDGSVERVLEGLGLTRHLTAVFDSRVVGFEKPDPRLFLHALKETGARAETTLHVGDLYDADVVGGRAAGVHVAMVDPYEDWKEADCYRLPTLFDLPGAIRDGRGQVG